MSFPLSLSVRRIGLVEPLSDSNTTNEENDPITPPRSK